MFLNNQDLNRIFDEMFSPNSQRMWVSSYSKPSQEDDSYEINQTADGAYLFFEAPGFNKTNLEVEIENGVLLIKGKRTYKINGSEKTKKISKKFTIGENYDPDSLEATIEDGLLTVFVPGLKKQEKKKINLS